MCVCVSFFCVCVCVGGVSGVCVRKQTGWVVGEDWWCESAVNHVWYVSQTVSALLLALLSLLLAVLALAALNDTG